MLPGPEMDIPLPYYRPPCRISRGDKWSGGATWVQLTRRIADLRARRDQRGGKGRDAPTRPPGGVYSAAERQALLEYCESDVNGLARLFPAMLPQLDLPRALLRGRFMSAAAKIEWNGTPIDTASWARLQAHWPAIRSRLISRIDPEYHVFLPEDMPVITGKTSFERAVLATTHQWQIDPYALRETAQYL